MCVAIIMEDPVIEVSTTTRIEESTTLTHTSEVFSIWSLYTNMNP